MGGAVNIPWVGRSICHGNWVQYTMDRRFDIPRVGRQNTMDSGSDITWVGGSIHHGYVVRYAMGRGVIIVDQIYH